MSKRVINSMGLGDSGGTALSSAPGVPTDVAASGYPSYCSWMPFADFLSECQVPTAAQILTANLSNYGAAATPDTIAAGQAAAADSIALDCTDNPDLCSQFTFAGSSPLTAAMLGSGTVGQAAGGLESATGTIASLFSSQWAWIGLGVVGLAFIFMGGRR